LPPKATPKAMTNLQKILKKIDETSLMSVKVNHLIKELKTELQNIEIESITYTNKQSTK
jgi:hypothetical protein